MATGLMVGEGAPGEPDFARVLFAHGSQIRAYQQYASLGGELWYKRIIEKNGDARSKP